MIRRIPSFALLTAMASSSAAASKLTAGENILWTRRRESLGATQDRSRKS